jgi:hypothetical protein
MRQCYLLLGDTLTDSQGKMCQLFKEASKMYYCERNCCILSARFLFDNGTTKVPALAVSLVLVNHCVKTFCQAASK